MDETTKQDAWLMAVFDVPVASLADAGGSTGADPRRQAGLQWEMASLQAQSTLRQLGTDMEQRGGADYLAAASMVRRAQARLAEPVASAKAAAALADWLASDRVVAGCDDLLHLRTPLRTAIGHLAEALALKGD